MKRRAFWLASLVLVATALCLHVGALENASGGAHNLARAVSAPENQKQQLKEEARRWAKNSGSLALAGLNSAVLSVVCLCFSFRKHEPARRSVPVGFLAVYLLLQFVLV